MKHFRFFSKCLLLLGIFVMSSMFAQADVTGTHNGLNYTIHTDAGLIDNTYYGATVTGVNDATQLMRDGVVTINDNLAYYNSSPVYITKITDGAFHTGTPGNNNILNGATSIILNLNYLEYIGKFAFRDITTLTSVSLNTPKLKTIERDAFRNCEQLTEITIPGSVTQIGYCVFYDCDALTEVTFEKNEAGTPLTIGYNDEGPVGSMFKHNDSLTRANIARNFAYAQTPTSGDNKFTPFSDNSHLTEVNFLDGATEVGLYMFYNNTALVNVTLNEGITSIKEGAFHGCSAITQITIPASVTTIAKNAFYNNTALVDVTLNEGIISINEGAFQGCSAITQLTIPASVITIEQNAFRDLSSLNYIEFVSGTSPISIARQYKSSSHYGPFYDSPLQTVKFDRPLTAYTTESEDDGLFYYKNAGVISYIELGSNVTSIPNYAFYSNHGRSAYNESLTEVVIPGNVESIGTDAFRDCIALSEVTIEEGVETIGNGVFRNCLALSRIDIPGTVSSIGENAFRDCTALKYVDLGSGSTSLTIARQNISDNYYGPFYSSPLETVKVGRPIVDYTQQDKNADDGIFYYNGTSMLKEIDLTGYSGKIYDYMFGFASGTNTTLEEVTIPNGVTIIGKYAFEKYAGLKNVKFEESDTEVTQTIDQYAFKGCTGLTSFAIAPTVNIVYDNIFDGCTSLAEVSINSHENYAATLTINTGDSFHGLFADAPLTHVNLNRNLIYNGVTPDNFTNAKKYSPFAAKTTLTTVNVGGKCTTIRDGLFGACSALTEVNISGDALTTIGKYAFRDCIALNNLTLPESLTTIGAEAFRECNVFTAITIPGNVATIGNTAFYGCDALAEVTFAHNSENTNNNVIALGYDESNTGGIFKDCGQLTTVNIGRTINYITHAPFAAHATITDVNFLEGATIISENMFNGSSVLQNVSMASTIVTISENAFKGCTALNNVALNNGLETIGTAAFKNCSTFTEISIPGTVTSIGNNAFNGCSAVTSVRFEPSTVTPAPAILVGIDSDNSRSLFQGLTAISEISVARNIDISISSADDIKKAPFANSSAVTATFEAGCTTIPRGFLYNSTALKSVYFQKGSVQTIGDYAFHNCTTLVDIEMGDALTTIKNNAFNGCTAIKELYIPGTVTSIEANVFYNATGLRKVNFASGTSALTIARQQHSNNNYYGPFYHSALDTIYFDRPLGTYTQEEGNADDGLFYYNGQSKLAYLELGDNVNRIPDYAFYFAVSGSNYNTTLTSLVIPNNVTSIGVGAFRDFTALTEVTMGEKVHTIGAEAFRNCEALPSIVIPESVTTMGENVFRDCDNLNYIYALPATPPAINTNTFYGRYDKANLYYSNTLYIDGTYSAWAQFNKRYALNSDGMEFVVNGVQYAITNATEGSLAVSVAKNTGIAYFGDVFIPENVTNPFNEKNYNVTGIKVNAFQDNEEVVRLHLPDNIVNTANSIPAEAFKGCSGLARIYLIASPNQALQLQNIPKSAFDADTYEKAWVYVPEAYIASFKQIEFWSDFKNVTHYDGVGFDFYDQGFMYRVNTERTAVSVVPNDEYLVNAGGPAAIPATVTNPYTSTEFKVTAIEDKALYDYDELTSLSIGGNVTTIGYTVFHGCDKLTSVTFEPALEGVSSTLNMGYDKKGSYSAFKHCKNLTEVIINRSLMPLAADQSKLKDSDFKYAAFGDNPYITTVTVGAGCDAFSNYMFRDCRNLTSITFADGATLATIGEQAFRNCEKLTAITIPGSVTTIGNSTFHDCDRLAAVTFLKNDKNTALTIGHNSVQTGSMFKHNSKLNTVTIARTLAPAQPPMDNDFKHAAFGDNQNVKSVTFQDGVVELSNFYFRNCKNLATVTFEDVTTLTTIGEGAFRDCIRLAGEVVLPEGVTTVGGAAFRNCEKITAITIPGTATLVGNTAFHDCSNLATVTFAYNETANSGDLQLGYNNVVNGSAFKNNSKLRTVNLARTVVHMNQYESSLKDNDFKYAPFGDNSNITTVNILKGCTALPAYMFRDCDNLATVNVDADNTFTGTIGNQAFRNCKKVTTINFTQAGSVGNAAFRDCTGLTTFTLGEGSAATTIGSEAFRNCKKLAALIIPNTVTSVGENAFYDMIGLKNIKFVDGDNNIEIARQRDGEIYYGPFYDSPLEIVYFGRPLVNYTVADENDGLFYYKNQGKIRTLELGESVTEIHDDMFSFDRDGNRNTTLTNVYIPEKVQRIGKRAFRDYTALTEVTFAGGVTTIDEDAFRNCEKLDAITIPSSVTTVAKNVFYDAKGLKSVTIRGGAGVAPLAIHRMQKGSSYYGAFYDSPLTTVVLERDINAQTYLVESEDDGLFYRNGDGQINSIIIGDYVTALGDYMFYCKNYNKKLTSVEIPNSVKSIGKGVFRDCVKLALVSINGYGALSTIGDEAFRNCEALTAFVFPAATTSIGTNAFKDCKKITELLSYAPTAPSAVEATFDSENYKKATLFLQTNGVTDSYTSHDVWKRFNIKSSGFPTDVEDVVDNSLRIYGNNGNVVVSGAEEGTVIAVYDLSGTMRHLSKAANSEERISISTHGIYIVRVGDRVEKVVL